MAKVVLDHAGILALRGNVEVQSELRITAKTVAAHAASIVARRSGRLAESITVVTEFPEVFVGTPGAGNAHLVELGTARMPANPYLVPAGQAAPGRFTAGGEDAGA